jgi:hypothetical protein
VAHQAELSLDNVSLLDKKAALCCIPPNNSLENLSGKSCKLKDFKK